MNKNFNAKLKSGPLDRETNKLYILDHDYFQHELITVQVSWNWLDPGFRVWEGERGRYCERLGRC